MPLRDIVLHMTAGSPDLAEARIAYGLDLAAAHKAGVTGLFTRPVFPVAYHYISATVVQDYLANVGRDAETAKKAFEKGLRDSGLSGRWIETEVGTLEAIQSHARIADLLVLAPPNATGSDPVTGQEYGSSVLPHDVILDLGRPVILLPRTVAPVSGIGHVLVGWNGSREAARAVHDALPIMLKAKAVTVLVAGQSRHRGGSGEDLVGHLVRHGVPAQLKVSRAGDAKAGDLLLEQAKSEGADLVVMGAYGYPRWRELVFGGATETILKEADIPVFFSR